MRFLGKIKALLSDGWRVRWFSLGRRNMKKNKDEVQESAEELVKIGPASLPDQLRVKRSKIAREMSAKIKELDRQIRLLEETDAEQMVRDGWNLLES